MQNNVTYLAKKINPPGVHSRLPNVQATACEYIGRGWQVVPILTRQKKPALRDWQNLSITEENVTSYLSHGDNVGVCLGRRSNGLTDLDLDCQEAVMLADYFLPPTNAIFGRRSKPRSHHLYYTDLSEIENRASIMFKAPSSAGGAMLAEVRIGGGDTGAQTMFPPSRHPKGELVAWDTIGDPAVVDSDDLMQRVAGLAAACLLVKYYPSEGSRNDAMLALSGVLARANWCAEAIDHFVRCVAWGAGDDEDRSAGALRALARLAHGEPTPGLPRLREHWGADVADTIGKWLGVSTGLVPAGKIVLPASAPVEWAKRFVELKFRRDETNGIIHYRGGILSV